MVTFTRQKDLTGRREARELTEAVYHFTSTGPAFSIYLKRISIRGLKFALRCT